MALTGSGFHLSVKYLKHEFAHWLVARNLGFRVGAVRLNMLDGVGAHDGSSFCFLTEGLSGTEDILSYIRRRVVVLFAGGYAESEKNGEVNRDVFDNEISDNLHGDFSKAMELIHLYRNIRHPDTSDDESIEGQILRIKAEFQDEAREIVLKNAILIHAVGCRMAQQIEGYKVELVVEHEQISEIIKIVEEATRPNHSLEGRRP